MSRSEKTHEIGPDNRVHWLDNLRTFMVFLVILCHAGGVYESSGIWASFWIVDDPAVNNLSDIVVLILDIFMMPTLFFISGYFVPLSLKHRTAWAFLRSKLKRLIKPWTLAVLTLVPLYKVIFLYSRNLPQEHWLSYFHWSNGIWNQNWLWFLPVLFLFNVLYLFGAKSKIRMPKLSVRSAILLAMLMGIAYSLAMDALGLHGWTKTFLLDFQNERLLIYFMAFLLGALCCRRQAFAARPKGRALYYGLNATAWIPITVCIIFLLYPWLHAGRSIVSGSTGRVIRWSCFHLSLFCIMYLLIETFRRYQAKQGPVRRELSRNSYGVYVIHVIVMGGIALGLLTTGIPSLLKYLVLTVSTYGVSQLVVCLGRNLVKAALAGKGVETPTMGTGSIIRTVKTFVVALAGVIAQIFVHWVKNIGAIR